MKIMKGTTAGTAIAAPPAVIEVGLTIDIAAAPMKVWRALSDFDRYPYWHPFREVIGQAALGEKVSLRIGPVPAKRRRLAARITAFEPGESLEFTTGLPILGYATETYTLERRPGGTRMRHIARAWGLMPRLLGPKLFGPGLTQVYRRVDEALASFVAPEFKPKIREPE